MPTPGLARDWMREQEDAARPVRTLYECSGGHWPPSLVRTILLATSDADANRASGDLGIERVRRGCRCVHRERARLSRRGRRSYCRMAVATRRNMLCFLSVLYVPAARLRLHAASSSTRRTCATSTTTHCSRCVRVRSPRCVDMLCHRAMVQHRMLLHGAM